MRVHHSRQPERRHLFAAEYSDELRHSAAWAADYGGETKKLIQERARVAEIFAASVEGGMRTLKMDGMEKIMMGLTDLKMVRQVCIK